MRFSWSNPFALSLLVLTSCAPGKGPAGSMGCSKTSSVLKTPMIYVNPTPSPFGSPPTMPEMPGSTLISEGENRARFYKYFGRNQTDSVGGYIYMSSREAGKPFGQLKPKIERCSVLIEFPSETGEVAPPGSAATTAKFPTTLSAIESYRFPTRSSPLKIRLFTAAHCLDWSTNESMRLAIYTNSGSSLPSFEDAYLEFDIKVPELEAVKKLRRSLIERLKDKSLNFADAQKVMNAFRPETRDLGQIFGIPQLGETPTSKQKCFIPTTDESAAQYSCATYHDLAILDVEIGETLSADKETKLKDVRDLFVNSLKASEAPTPANVTNIFNMTGSIWADYVGANANFQFTRNIINSAIGNVSVSSSPGCAALPADKKLALYKPDSNCIEVPLSTVENLHYVRYISRERMRTFSQFNMTPFLHELTDGLTDVPLSLHQCGQSQSGVCAVSTMISEALSKVVEQQVLDSGLTKANYRNSYAAAAKKVDALLSTWSPFFKASEQITRFLDGDITGFTNDSGINDPIALKLFMNPVKFMRLNSNFVIQLDSDSNLPSSDNTTLSRAFLTMPLQNIVGDPSMTLNSEDQVAVDSWSSEKVANGGGRYLRFFSLQSTLDSFFSNMNNMAGIHFFPNQSGTAIQVDENYMKMASNFDPSFFNNKSIPSTVTLQKGDSGSIFTLDGIPMFALSTVNGEATSGGAAVRSIPGDTADSYEEPPTVVSGNGGSGPGGGVVQVPAGGKTAAVAACK